MPPKGKKSGPAASKQKEEEREEPLQAVILADPFETRFRPLTLETPRCLLPLANTPLIEYTFEFLANAGVDEVFVYCGAHADTVEDYISRSRWSSVSSPFAKLEIIRSSGRSMGDAMRDLDKRSVLAGDFIIVYGDVVSNLPLEEAMNAHRARRSKDRNAIMTMVLRQAGAQHRTKEQGVRPVFVIDPTKDRCLHFEQLRPKTEDEHVVSIDPEMLMENQEIEVRQDLIDCGIDICTPEALSLWSDNFDYEAPRKGFLHGVLKDYELNGKTIHTYIVDDYYAARVRNLHAYDAISRDVVSRWAYPICPDTNLLRGQSYRMQKGNIYEESGVVLARSCAIHPNTVIGNRTSIGDRSVISNSVIGRKCSIGKNVRIDGAYIWDGVTIQDGTTVNRAIIASYAEIGKNCHIQAGALVSYGVTIADKTTVDGTSRLTKVKQQDGQDNGPSYDYDDSDEDEEVMGGVTGLVYNMRNLSASNESISTLNSQADSSEDSFLPRDRSGSIPSIGSEESQTATQAGDFHAEAAGSIFDSLQRGDESTNIQLELNALRMSTNASPHQVRRALVASFMKQVAQRIEGGATVKKAIEETVRPHLDIFRRNFFDYDLDEKADQLDFLFLLQGDLAHRQQGGSIMFTVCWELLTKDILQVEAFEQWWDSEKSKEGEGYESIRAGMEQFIDSILGESEEEESEEDDDSE